MTARPHIDLDRLLADLDRLARIGGRENGGVTRLAFSADDRRGRDVVESLLAEIGIVSRFDAVGNLLAVRAGTDPSAALVLTGSHTDTVGDGGRYDGALGVLAGVAVLRALVEADVRTRRPVGVVSFVNEEGVRFMPDMMGSLYARGSLELDALRQATATDGARLGDEIDRHGLAGNADLRALDVHGFVELHIEQGPVLERADEPIAVVEGVQGLRWYRVRLAGSANHAGTTPMEDRRDAGVCGARIVSGVRDLAASTDGLRATCGRFVPGPNLVNVIPGTVELTVDVRHPDAGRLEAAVDAVRTIVEREAEREGVHASIDVLADAPPVAFDPRMVGALETAAAEAGHPCRRMVSGAGHDAQIMSARWPTAMLFVRSRRGISHSPEEFTAPPDIAVACDVLLRSVRSLTA